jgi:hypothetical protein
MRWHKELEMIKLEVEKYIDSLSEEMQKKKDPNNSRRGRNDGG